MPRRLPSPDRALRNQRKRFIKRFGREPGPGDPLFFDPDATGDVPVPYDEKKFEREVLDAMSKAGTPLEIAYAFAKTGYLILESRLHLYSPEVIAQWKAAIAEYQQMQGGKPN